MYVRLYGIRLVKKKLLELFLVYFLESTVDNCKKLREKQSDLKFRSVTVHLYIHSHKCHTAKIYFH